MGGISVLGMLGVSIVIVLALLVFAVCVWLLAVVCWILGIVFSVQGKKKPQKIFLTIATVTTVLGLIMAGVGYGRFYDATHTVIKTGKEKITVSAFDCFRWEEAVEEDQIETVKKMLQEQPAWKDYPFQEEYSLYEYALLSESPQIARYLLEQGTPVDQVSAREYNGAAPEAKTALQLYFHENNGFDIEDFNIVDSDSDVEPEYDFDPESDACPLDLSIIQLLLDYRASVEDCRGEKPIAQSYLEMCCSDGEIAKEEIQLFVRLHETGMTIDSAEEGEKLSDYFARLGEITGIRRKQSKEYQKIAKMLQ